VTGSVAGPGRHPAGPEPTSGPPAPAARQKVALGASFC